MDIKPYMCVTGVDELRFYAVLFAIQIRDFRKTSDTFRNLSLILLRLRMSKEQSAVIFKNNFHSSTHRLCFFSQIFEKIMIFMS